MIEDLKSQADQEWDAAFQAALNGKIDKAALAAAMQKCNDIDKKILEEKYKKAQD